MTSLRSLDKDSAKYFRESREKMMGKSFEELKEGREASLATPFKIQPFKSSAQRTPCYQGTMAS